MDVDNFLKSSFFKSIKTDFSRCWEPYEKCNSKPIRAHSIQNSRVLEELCIDGHVIMPNEAIEQKGEVHTVSFKEVGRNEASTFKGLCKTHDNEIFSPIDNFDIELSNEQQLFLLAYRSVLKKLHFLSLAAVRVHKIYEGQLKVDRATQNINDPLLNAAIFQLKWAYRAYLYKRRLDEAYKKREFYTLRHTTLSFMHKRPTTAASAFYWLETRKPNSIQVPWIALNVFPAGNETLVIYSYLDEDTSYVDQETKDILNSSNKRRLWLLSKVIIESTENFVISPRYWNNLSTQKKEKIVSYYHETISNKKSIDDIRVLSLFELSDKK